MKFIIPPTEEVKIGKNTYHNCPINLDLVMMIEKTTMKALSENNITAIDFPIIRFHGRDRNSEQSWSFSQYDERERNRIYNEILSNANPITI